MGPFQFTPLQLIVLAVAITVTAALVLALYRTDLGIKIRAVAKNPNLAATSGVHVARMRIMTWSIASGLAGLGGVLFGVTVTFNSGFGFSLLLTVAAAAILGGLGSPVGAVVGALVVGVVTEVSTEWVNSALKPGVAFVALALVMLIRRAAGGSRACRVVGLQRETRSATVKRRRIWSPMPDDVYTHGHADSVLRSHRWRTAKNSAAYLLPHLDSTARILDVGCGPGTITLDLARSVDRGFVMGLDRSEEVIEQAIEARDEADLPNVDFTAGDVYALDFPDASFDVVHAHQVLQHLSDPVAALREMRRVCKPEGLVAARDADYAAFSWWPAVPELDTWLDLYRRVARSNDAEPDAGRRIKSWALAAGFLEVQSSADVWCYETASDVEWWSQLWADRVTKSSLADQARARGFADQSELDRLADGWRAWAAAEDAWFATPHGEVLCRP